MKIFGKIQAGLWFLIILFNGCIFFEEGEDDLVIVTVEFNVSVAIDGRPAANEPVEMIIAKGLPGKEAGLIYTVSTQENGYASVEERLELTKGEQILLHACLVNYANTPVHSGNVCDHNELTWDYLETWAIDNGKDPDSFLWQPVMIIYIETW